MLLRFKVVIESVIVGRWYANLILFKFSFIFYSILFHIIICVIVTDVTVTMVRCY